MCCQHALVSRAVCQVTDQSSIQLELSAVRSLWLWQRGIAVQEHTPCLDVSQRTLENLEQCKLAVEMTVAVAVDAATKEDISLQVERARG